MWLTGGPGCSSELALFTEVRRRERQPGAAGAAAYACDQGWLLLDAGACCGWPVLDHHGCVRHSMGTLRGCSFLGQVAG